MIPLLSMALTLLFGLSPDLQVCTNLHSPRLNGNPAITIAYELFWKTEKKERKHTVEVSDTD
jgi:hypothetical protein